MAQILTQEQKMANVLDWAEDVEEEEEKERQQQANARADPEQQTDIVNAPEQETQESANAQANLEQTTNNEAGGVVGGPMWPDSDPRGIQREPNMPIDLGTSPDTNIDANEPVEGPTWDRIRDAQNAAFRPQDLHQALAMSLADQQAESAWQTVPPQGGNVPSQGSSSPASKPHTPAEHSTPSPLTSPSGASTPALTKSQKKNGARKAKKQAEISAEAKRSSSGSRFSVLDKIQKKEAKKQAIVPEAVEQSTSVSTSASLPTLSKNGIKKAKRRAKEAVKSEIRGQLEASAVVADMAEYIEAPETRELRTAAELSGDAVNRKDVGHPTQQGGRKQSMDRLECFFSAVALTLLVLYTSIYLRGGPEIDDSDPTDFALSSLL